MKRSHALIVLLVLIGSTVVSSLYGYGSAKARVDADLRQALALTMQEQPSDVITADTIRVFNSHLQMAELRGRHTGRRHAPAPLPLLRPLFRGHGVQPL